MGPDDVVVVLPDVQDRASVGERDEQGLVQQLVPEAAIEALNEGVLGGLAGCDVVPVAPPWGCLCRLLPSPNRQSGAIGPPATARRDASNDPQDSTAGLARRARGATSVKAKSDVLIVVTVVWDGRPAMGMRAGAGISIAQEYNPAFQTAKCPIARETTIMSLAIMTQ